MEFTEYKGWSYKVTEDYDNTFFYTIRDADDCYCDIYLCDGRELSYEDAEEIARRLIRGQVED